MTIPLENENHHENVCRKGVDPPEGGVGSGEKSDERVPPILRRKQNKF